MLEIVSYHFTLLVDVKMRVYSLLDSKALSAPFAETDHEFVEVDAVVCSSEPAFGVEGVGIRKDGRVHVNEVGYLTDWRLRLY